MKSKADTLPSRISTALAAGEMTLRQLSDVLNVDTDRVRKATYRLFKKGLVVQRVRSRGDRRVIVYVLLDDDPFAGDQGGQPKQTTVPARKTSARPSTPQHWASIVFKQEVKL